MTVAKHDAEAGAELGKAKVAILEATLRHVPFEGWSARALQMGAKEAGVPDAVLSQAFPRGPADLFRYFMDISDRQMVTALKTKDLGAMRFRDRVALAIRTRLEQNASRREASRRLASYLLLPPNAPLAAAAVWRTADAIWHALGDRSADFSYYTKRSLLAGVYASTFFCWLNDSSEGFADTWAFLDRRIADVMRIPEIRGRAEKLVGCVTGPLKRRWAARR